MQNDAQERARGEIITRRAWRNRPFRPRLLLWDGRQNRSLPSLANCPTVNGCRPIPPHDTTLEPRDWDFKRVAWGR